MKTFNTLEEWHEYFLELAKQDKKQEPKKVEIKPTVKKVINSTEQYYTYNNMIVRQVAKLVSDNVGIEIGQNRLYKKLRQWGMIIPNTTEPYQKCVKNGYFCYVSKVIDTQYGDRIVRWTKVTPKGTAYIIKRLREENEI